MTAVTALALTPLALTGAGSAAELADRRQGVERDIARAEQHLDQSTAALIQADRRLAQAQTSLRASRTALAQTRTGLAAAEALDRQLQGELEEAIDDLARARVVRAQSRTSFRSHQEAVRALVVSQYASGGPDVMALQYVLDTQDPGELTAQMAARSAVLDVQGGALARLTASQALLDVQEAGLRDAKRKVSAQRAAAAANMARMVQLEAQAASAAEQVASLVVERSQARQSAAEARAEDRFQVQQLEAERAEISALLRRQAAQARAEAEAKAAADAAAADTDAGSTGGADSAAAGTATETHAPPSTDPAPQPAPTAGVMAYPVDGYITSPYGMRLHPVYQVWKLHDGTDIGAACGTPVRAAESGTVIATYYGDGYGNRIIIDHGLRDGVGLGTTYNHLSGYATSPGDRVERGEVIGYVGTTGASTGCHLHFMVFEDGATVDPMTWLN